MEKDNIITEESELKKILVGIIKGSIFSIIISAILLLIFAVLLSYTNLSENTMLPVTLVVTGVSILIGSMMSTRKIRKNGILNGGMVGVIYIITLYLISSLFLAGFNLTFKSKLFVILIAREDKSELSKSFFISLAVLPISCKIFIVLGSLLI